MARRTTLTGTAEPAKSLAPRTRRPAPDIAAAPPALDGQATRREPTQEQIRRRAYELYLARAGRGGSPDADWLQAERELRARH